jgi:hypothetical protein
MTEEKEPTKKQDVEAATDAEREGGSGSRLSSQKDLVAGLAGSTSRIVGKAASILEEEIATGIRVTQDIEKKYVDVDEMRSKDPQGVIQRFRKDAHDVVDILVDLVNVATNAVTGLTERGVSIGIGEKPEKPEKKKEAGAVIPSLTFPSAVKPGQAVDIPMTLENESDQSTEAFFLHSSDLVNTTGERISADQISFAPEELAIEPRSSAVVTVTVRVPKGTPPGVYSGLLQATQLKQLRAVLSIQIE